MTSSDESLAPSNDRGIARVYAWRVGRAAAGWVAIAGAILVSVAHPGYSFLMVLHDPPPLWGPPKPRLWPAHWPSYFVLLCGAWIAALAVLVLGRLAAARRTGVDRRAASERLEAVSLAAPLTGIALLGSHTTFTFTPLAGQWLQIEMLWLTQAVAVLGCVLFTLRMRRRRPDLGEGRAYSCIVALGCLFPAAFSLIGGPYAICMLFVGVPLAFLSTAMCWLFLPLTFVAARKLVMRERVVLQLGRLEPPADQRT